MPFTIRVDMPNLSPGTEVQIPGLGVFENGKTVRITDEQAEMFRSLNSHPVDEFDSEGKRTGAYHFEPGPPLDEATLPQGVTVKADSKSASTTTEEEGS